MILLAQLQRTIQPGLPFYPRSQAKDVVMRSLYRIIYFSVQRDVSELMVAALIVKLHRPRDLFVVSSLVL